MYTHMHIYIYSTIIMYANAYIHITTHIFTTVCQKYMKNLKAKSTNVDVKVRKDRKDNFHYLSQIISICFIYCSFFEMGFGEYPLKLIFLTRSSDPLVALENSCLNLSKALERFSSSISRPFLFLHSL